MAKSPSLDLDDIEKSASGNEREEMYLEPPSGRKSNHAQEIILSTPSKQVSAYGRFSSY
jgi:hypothetical protein